MSEAVVLLDCEGLKQALAGVLEVVLGPLEEAQVPVGVFHGGVEADGFPVLAGGFGPTIQAGEYNTAEVADAGVLGMFSLGTGQRLESGLDVIVPEG